MKALTVLYGGALVSHAREPVFRGGKNALDLALQGAGNFPGTEKIILLGREGDPLWERPLPWEKEEFAGTEGRISLVSRPRWTKKTLLESLSVLSRGFDLTYFAWADCPFLDPVLAGAVAGRHLRYAAEYSYADGWPYGFAPEILAPGTAGILRKILADDGAVERDCLFSVLQKDINAFDIETEISKVDLRCHRLSLCADSRRNLLLLSRFAASVPEGTVPSASGAADLISTRPQMLRTLPNFFPVQVSGPCAQACSYCPYPQFSSSPSVLERGDFMEASRFEKLIDKIAAFSGDAVIDLSLWGEISLHPQKMDLIRSVLARGELALILETSGVGWKEEELEKAAELAGRARSAPERISPLPPLSWIVSLDASESGHYREIRGPGFTEAVQCAKKLFSLFPADAYVQAVRMKGDEDAIEQFYRFWKEASPRGPDGVIIQKYDDFCGALPQKQATDLSPVTRQPCWHIMRDLAVLMDGTVPLCREDLDCLKNDGKNPRACGKGTVMGNAFTDTLETIWERGSLFYEKQCYRQDDSAGPGCAPLCAVCDEYYTYNF
jgi:spiro-SPASM protein